MDIDSKCRGCIFGAIASARSANRQSRKTFLVILLLAPLLIQASPVSAARKKQLWLSVPVFFATTRLWNEAKDKYGGERNLDKQDQGIEYGIVTLQIPVEEQSDIDKPSMVKLGWRQLEKRQTKIAKIEKLSREDFYKALQARHQSTQFQESCIFVHGYNNPFEGAAESAARLEVALREPVVLFSWPSAAKLKGYTTDECNAEWSVRPFQVFMQGLEKQFDSKHLMTVSHSMGNRLVNWYLQQRYDKAREKPDRFAEVVLTSPDIDRATFKNYFYKVSANGEKVRIYISRKDIPLRLSKFVHGNSRTGSEMTRNENKWEMPGNIEGTQTVNFTAVDSGVLGHSIQFKVIGAMHRTGVPGGGLKLQEDPTYKGDYVRIDRAE